MDNKNDDTIKTPPFVRMFYFILELSYLGLMLNEPRRVVRVQAGGGVRSTEPLLKVWCEQQPRRGGRMTTSYSGLLISYHRQAGVTLRSTTCLWSSQPFGLHFTTSSHTR